MVDDTLEIIEVRRRRATGMSHSLHLTTQTSSTPQSPHFCLGVQVHRHNTGRDSFPLLLSRRQLPQEPSIPPVGEFVCVCVGGGDFDQ